MERYGRSTTEGYPSDPSPEWTAAGAEPGLEESSWPLVLGSDGHYPERPDEANCIFYLRTGFCGYGARCRFNHPRDRGAAMGAARGVGGEFPERVGQPVCQYYMRTGTCKFGASCKYHHPRQGGGSVSHVSLNIDGYPLRQGEKECSYYVKTGQCKFGASCKFHHPQPAGVQLPVQSPAAQIPPMPVPVPPPTLYPPVQSPSGSSAQQYGVVVARPSFLQGSYVQSTYGPMLISPGMVPFPSWGGPYMAPVSPLPSSSNQPPVGSPGPVYGITQFSPSAPAYTGQYQPMPSPSGPSISSQKEHQFPDRPGQPECQYFMRTGECKFGSSCRYHHPPDVTASKTTVVLSPVGLPIRQDAPLCTHYAQRGVCKFGAACKFNHPMGTLSYSPSASSLSDMPVAPYPVGSSVGTLAPSSSSSDLRPELSLASGKDSTSSARMSSSLSTSSASVGSTFSKGSSVSHLSLQQSAQSPGTTAGGNSSTNTESRTSS